MLDIRQSEEARQSLADIYHYSEQRWGAKQAQKYLRQILGSFDALAKNPDLGYTYRELPGTQYRLFPVTNYMVIYRVLTKTLLIVAVIHMSMNIDTRLATLMETYH